MIVAELALLVTLAQRPSRVCLGTDVNDPRAFPAMLVQQLPRVGLSGEIKVTAKDLQPYVRVSGQWRALPPPFAVWPYRFPCATGLPSTAVNTGPLTLPPTHLVALVFCDSCEPVKIELRQALLLYRKAREGSLISALFTERQNDRLLAALVVALGTLPDERRVFFDTLAKADPYCLDWEVRRGVRLPTQDAEPVRH